MTIEDLRLRVWRVLSAQQRLGYDFEGVEIRLNPTDWAHIEQSTANTVPTPYTDRPRLFGFALVTSTEVPVDTVWVIHKVAEATRWH